jgi:hypothetical protein
MIFGRHARDLTPLDLQVLEPDLLGTVTMVLYGQDQAHGNETADEPRSFRDERPSPGPVQD